MPICDKAFSIALAKPPGGGGGNPLPILLLSELLLCPTPPDWLHWVGHA
jgi:hypothetical protein